QPCIELCLAAELGQSPVGPDKGFLGNVFDQVHIPHHASDQTLDTALVFDDQQLEGLLVTRHCAFDQQGIAVAGRRGRSGRKFGAHGERRGGSVSSGKSSAPTKRGESGNIAVGNALRREYTARRKSSQRSGMEARWAQSQS